MGQFEHAAARTGRRIGYELAAQPGQDPVAEHADVGDRREDLGLVAGNPAETRGRGDRHPVATLRSRWCGACTALDRAPPPRRRPASRRWGRPRSRCPTRRTAPCPRACWCELTAATARRRCRRSAQRLADALADQLPVARRVEHLGAGGAGQRGMRPLPLADRELVSLGIEQHGPAAAGARVDGQQIARRSSASAPAVDHVAQARLPAAKRSDLVHQHRRAPWASVSWVAPPMWGVMTTFGMPSSGCATGRRRGLHARRAPRRRCCPDPSAAPGASSSTSDLAAVLMKNAPGCIAANAVGVEQIRVLGGRPGVERDEVRLGQQLVEADRAAASAHDLGAVDVRIVARAPRMPNASARRRLAGRRGRSRAGPGCARRGRCRTIRAPS